MEKVERWLPVFVDGVVYTGYEVSSFGRIRSYMRRGPGTNLHTMPRVVYINRHNSGYMQVRVAKQFPKRWLLVHRLVLEAFKGPCPAGMLACHNNGVRADNRLENLRWDTPQANEQDKLRHGTQNSGESLYRLSDDAVAHIRELRGVLKQRELAKLYNVSTSCITRLWNGYTRKRPLKQDRAALAPRVETPNDLERYQGFLSKKNRRCKVSDADVEAIRQLRGKLSRRAIAEKYSIGMTYVTRLWAFERRR